MPFEDKPFHVTFPDMATGGITMAMIGSTRSGKTTLLKHSIVNLFDKHITVLMSPSLHAPVYADIGKQLIKAPEFVPAVIEECYKINKGTKNEYPFAIILDDIVTAKWCKTLMKCFTIYRNSGISTIMSVQNPIILNSVTRSNFNYCLLGYLNSCEAVEKVLRMFCWTDIAGKNLEEKVKEYQRLTEGHHWLFLDFLTGERYRFKLSL